MILKETIWVAYTFQCSNVILVLVLKTKCNRKLTTPVKYC